MGGKRCGRQITQTGVRPFGIIFVPPGCEFPPPIKEISEPTRVQALIAQLACEALDMPILHRSTRLDMYEADLTFHAPGEEVPGSQLRTVIAPDALWLSTPGDDPFKDPRDSPACEARIDFQCEALTRERIDDAQHADSAAGRNCVGGKVQRPLFIRRSNGIGRNAASHQ